MEYVTNTKMGLNLFYVILRPIDLKPHSTCSVFRYYRPNHYLHPKNKFVIQLLSAIVPLNRLQFINMFDHAYKALKVFYCNTALFFSQFIGNASSLFYFSIIH